MCYQDEEEISCAFLNANGLDALAMRSAWRPAEHSTWLMQFTYGSLH